MIPTKVATGLATGRSLDAAHQVIDLVTKQLAGEAPKLLLVFGSTKQPLAEVMPALHTKYKESIVVGCSSAGEFTERGDSSGSMSMFALAGDHKVFAGMARGLRANVEQTVAAAISELPSRVDGYPHRTLILVLDSLCGVAEEAALLTSALLGGDARLVGGAAADDLAMAQTFVGLGKRVGDDALVVVAIHSKKPCGIGVAHGHQPFSKPIEVTKSEGNVVHELDGENAWDLWTRLVKERVPGVNTKQEALGAFFAEYEASLAVGEEFKNRAPVGKTPSGAIAFGCGIPTGTIIRIAQSNPSLQLESAREAARRARAQMGSGAVAGALVFDCVCRKAILGEQFGAAMQAISKQLGGVPLAGCETYGEIAADVGDMSGYHNSTTVVLAFPQ